MSVAVCRSSSMPTTFADGWLVPAQHLQKGGEPQPMTVDVKVEENRGQFDIWSSIQAHNAAAAATKDQLGKPYVHPLVRRSSSSLSQKSLEICTENLGSESGSDGFSSGDEMDYLSPLSAKSGEKEPSEEEGQDDQLEQEEGGFGYLGGERAAVRRQGVRKELATVNYHCAISRKSPARTFPPPLPSISRRDGLCLHMRPHRRDGRLVVEAVPVPSQNYLHAERQGGRLLLSFIDTTISHEYPLEKKGAFFTLEQQRFTAPEEEDEVDAPAAVETDFAGEEEEEEEEAVEEEEEDEEEVEVVDRGTMVEVKVSTQPQQQSGAVKVHRSSVVINKFVGGTPLPTIARPDTDDTDTEDTNSEDKHFCQPTLHRRLAPTTTTAAVAVVAASSLSATSSQENGEYYYYNNNNNHHHHHDQPVALQDSKLLFASKNRSREELLHDMSRCSQLRRPLFIWEPCCIATSS